MSKPHKPQKNHHQNSHGKPRQSAEPAPRPAQAAQVGAAQQTTGGQIWQFEPLDTWFFRESRPLESVGGAQLTSQFPPPVRTLVGAIRTTVGDALGVNWPDYHHREDHPLRALMGSPTNLAPLHVQGPYLMENGQRLYPAPLVVMESGDGAALTRLTPGSKPVWCDLGRVRLPQASERVKPLDECWLTAEGLQAVLTGRTPSASEIRKAKTLTHAEPRLGIALDGHARRPLDGMLYQTRHLRLAEGVSVGLTLQGLSLPACGLGQQGIARLGGEGRLAAWSRHPAQAVPTVPLKSGAQRLMLALLTPARFSQGWLPEGFVPRLDADGITTAWCGTLVGKAATLVSAVTGKPLRQGGWDMASHQPRDLYALVPAGSCYFFEFESPEDAHAVATACHGAHIGQDTAWGYGQVAVSVW